MSDDAQDRLDDVEFLSDAPSSRRPRRFWRWIGALLIVALAGGAGVGWLEWRRAQRIDALVAELRASNAVVKVTRGGPEWLNQSFPDRPWIRAFDSVDVVDVSVHDDPPFDDLVSRLGECGQIDVLNMAFRKTENEHLRGLAGLDLRELTLQSTPVDDAGLRRLDGLGGLRLLSLAGCPVTDAGLVNLRGSTLLESLDLRETGVTDEGLAALAAFSRLESLSLGKTAVRGPGLSHLRGIASLRSLSLGDARADDWQLDALAELRGVTTLAIFGNGVRDEHVPVFARMPALESLSLSSTSISDAGLLPLHGLKQLKRVELHGTKCTRRGVTALHKALPACEIESRFAIAKP